MKKILLLLTVLGSGVISPVFGMVQDGAQQSSEKSRFELDNKTCKTDRDLFVPFTRSSRAFKEFIEILQKTSNHYAWLEFSRTHAQDIAKAVENNYESRLLVTELKNKKAADESSVGLILCDILQKSTTSMFLQEILQDQELKTIFMAHADAVIKSLQLAVKEGRLAIVEEIIQNIDLRAYLIEKYSPELAALVRSALSNSSFETSKKLLSIMFNNPDMLNILCTFQEGFYLVFEAKFATENGRVDILKFLLEKEEIRTVLRNYDQGSYFGLMLDGAVRNARENVLTYIFEEANFEKSLFYGTQAEKTIVSILTADLLSPVDDAQRLQMLTRVLPHVSLTPERLKACLDKACARGCERCVVTKEIKQAVQKRIDDLSGNK